jgi:hypothetical protein
VRNSPNLYAPKMNSYPIFDKAAENEEAAIFEIVVFYKP